jgi:hypothetical protein
MIGICIPGIKEAVQCFGYLALEYKTRYTDKHICKDIIYFVKLLYRGPNKTISKDLLS